MSARGRGDANRQAGFSLVEVLVAVAVMAIMMGTAGTALRLMSSAIGRGNAHVDQIDMAVRGLAAVRNDLARIERATETDRQAVRFVFIGEAQLLRFVLVEPDRPGDPGTYLVTYATRRNGADNQLVRSRNVYDPGQRRKAGAADEASEVVVLQGAYRFEFSYLQRTDGRTRWTPKWTDSRSIPEMVRLAAVATRPNVPPLPDVIARPRVDAEASCLAGGTQPCTPRSGGRLPETVAPRAPEAPRR